MGNIFKKEPTVMAVKKNRRKDGTTGTTVTRNVNTGKLKAGVESTSSETEENSSEK